MVDFYLDTDVVGGLADGSSWDNAYASFSAAMSGLTLTEDSTLHCRGAAAATTIFSVSGIADTYRLHILGDWDTGMWDESKIRLDVTQNTGQGRRTIFIQDNYVTIENLQIRHNNSSTGTINIIDVDCGTNSSDNQIKNCLLTANAPLSTAIVGIELNNTVTIENTVIFDLGGNGTGTYPTGYDAATQSIDRCTVSGCNIGISRGGNSSLSVSNSAVFNNSNDFNGTLTTSYCASDNNDNGGTGDFQITQTANDYAALVTDATGTPADFSPTDADSELVGNGEDGVDIGAIAFESTNLPIKLTPGDTHEIAWNGTSFDIVFNSELSSGDVLTIGSTNLPIECNPITTGTPVIGSLSVGQTHTLGTTSITTLAVILDSPTLSEIQEVIPLGITTQNPTLGSPNLGQAHNLDPPDLLTANSVIEDTTVGQTHGLGVDGLITGSPDVGTTSLGGEVSVTPDDIVTNAPDIGNFDIAQDHSVTPDSIITGVPSIGSPVIVEEGVLIPLSFQTETPTIGTTSLGQNHNLDLIQVITNVPTIGTTDLGQKHELTIISITCDTPVLESPTIIEEGGLIPLSFQTEAPIIGTTSLGQKHSLDLNQIVTETPIIGTTNLSGIIEVVPENIIVSVPIIGTTTIEITHTLVSNNITTDSPILGEIIIGQIHGLLLSDITTDNIIIDETILDYTQLNTPFYRQCLVAFKSRVITIY